MNRVISNFFRYNQWHVVPGVQDPDTFLQHGNPSRRFFLRFCSSLTQHKGSPLPTPTTTIFLAMMGVTSNLSIEE
jgi:hypothetical protein